MKTRLIHPAVAALAAGLLLASCSGGGSDSDDNADDIDGVQTEEEQTDDESESADPTPTDDGIDRPEIDLPDDMNNVFEDTETGDPTQDAIIADVVQGINAVDMAISESDPDLEAVEFYNVGDALVTARSYIRGAAEANDTWTGSVEYYDFSVDTEAANPVVTYCSDVRERRTKELDTGDVLPRSADAHDFAYHQLVALETDAGVWQTAEVLPRDEELDPRCER